MEQLVILIIIGAISLINWLLQKSAEHKSKRPPGRSATEEGFDGVPAPLESRREPRHEFQQEDHRPVPTADPQAELRRFFEAMGLPLEEEPVRPAPITPSFQEPPALPEPPAPIAPAPIAPVVQPTRARSISPREKVSARYAELAKGFARAEQTTEALPTVDFHEFLKSPASLRQAIILREILGPPKALADSSW